MLLKSLSVASPPSWPGDESGKCLHQIQQLYAYRIMYGIEWRAIHALTRGLFYQQSERINTSSREYILVRYRFYSRPYLRPVACENRLFQQGYVINSYYPPPPPPRVSIGSDNGLSPIRRLGDKPLSEVMMVRLSTIVVRLSKIIHM